MRVLDLTVNGVAARCLDGGRVLDAIKASGFKVPTLCYDDRVGPKGTCRACMVEVEVQGKKQTVAACTWSAAAGMKIETHPPEIKAYRRTLLELLLSETASPNGCPRCNTTGKCELHGAADEYGAKWDAFRPLQSRPKADDPNPFIQRDYDYCIACYRCTNVCNEWEQAAAITVQGRGQASSIASVFNNRLLESPCTFCGQCINTCPTGALTDRKVVWKTDPARLKRTRTTCPYCGVGCGIHLLSQEGSLVGVEPDFSAPSRGSLCVKGQFASWEFARSGDRLTAPLMRVRSGAGRSPSDSFRPVSWDEALGAVADRFRGVISSGGPDSVVLWASARVVNEANYLMQKFARVAIGTNNIDNCSRT
jgi:formate dehydrogenase alpha subunit